ncbi:MAG TPA: EAL domain-containing protein [Acidimicrobiales bacterium]|nr:EAL domain-containing protein [Acidimicrobiales bacterium]
MDHQKSATRLAHSLAGFFQSDELLDAVPAGIVVQDQSGEIVGFNEPALKMLGTSREELAGRAFNDPAWDTVREDGTPFPIDELPAAITLATGEPCFDVVVGTENWHQARRWILVNTNRISLDDGSLGVMSAFVDVTQRVIAARTLGLLSRVNQDIIKTNDEAACLQELCATLVDTGGYDLAWIGTASEVDGGVDIVCSAGKSDYLYDGIATWWGTEDSGKGPSGTALRMNTTQVLQDLANNAHFTMWRVRAEKFGLKSSVAIPMTWGQSRAVVSIYDNSIFAFDDATVVGLEELVREVEFGLAHFQSVRQRIAALESAAEALASQEAAEEELTRSGNWFRQLLAHSSDFILVLDKDRRLTFANPAALDFVGATMDEVLGIDLYDLVHPDDRAAAAAAFDFLRQSADRAPTGFYRVQSVTGEWRNFETISTNCLDDPSVRGIIINARDTTEKVNLSRALRTLSKGSQILIHATDETALLNDVCATIVETGYLLAWVGFARHDEPRSVDIVAAAGAVESLTGLGITWAEDETGDGPTGRTLRTGTVQVIDHAPVTSTTELRRQRAAEYGIESICAMPINLAGDLVGALTICASQPGAFGPEEMALLTQLTGEMAYGLGRLRDAAHLSQQGRRLRAAEQRFRLAFESNMAPMVFSDLGDRVIDVNDAFCAMVGYTREELVGHDSKIFTLPEDVGITEDSLGTLTANNTEQVRYIKRYLRKDGRIVYSEVSRSAARSESGETLYFLASERDVTDEHELADQLRHQALHDSLTGLANRALFEDRLIQARARISRVGGFGAVLLLDLDDFKTINDTFGHVFGDQLLVAMARRLESVSRSVDTLSRLGGDEFLYLAEGLDSEQEAVLIAERLISALDQPFVLDDISIQQHASVGIAVWDQSSPGSRDLIQNADVALYEAKRGGKNGSAVFTPSMHQRVVSTFTMVQELRGALAGGQLLMHYQPIIDLTTTQVVGFEALMRWPHEERGWIPPDTFIPLAEQSDLIAQLGAFAIREAVSAAATWPLTTSGQPTYVTVNLSANQFRDPNLISTITSALASSGLPASSLMVEITEGVTFLDLETTLETLDELKRLGVGFALDDFGTGYSSLSYLVRLHPRVIKIDRFFVGPAHESPDNHALLETIVELGNKLGITMIAEGIETLEQRDRLRELNCPLGQGFLFSRAVPLEETVALFASIPAELAAT